MSLNASAPFDWSEVESDDYRAYVANLRAIGCPEQSIADIIRADVAELFAHRTRPILAACHSEYWQRPASCQTTPARETTMQEALKEKGDILQELLDVACSEQEWIDTMFLQVHGSEYQLLFLPPEKRRAALDALRSANLLYDVEGSVGEMNRYGHFKKRLAILERVLTPAEHQEFHVRNSPVAQFLGEELRYFPCTVEEFRQVLLACERELEDASSPSEGWGSIRARAIENARKLLGENRVSQLERVSDIFYRNARRAAEECGLPADVAEAGFDVYQCARTGCSEIRRDSSLASVERNRRVLALYRDAETRLRQLFGEKKSRRLCRELQAGMHLRPEDLQAGQSGATEAPDS